LRRRSSRRGRARPGWNTPVLRGLLDRSCQPSMEAPCGRKLVSKGSGGGTERGAGRKRTRPIPRHQLLVGQESTASWQEPNGGEERRRTSVKDCCLHAGFPPHQLYPEHVPFSFPVLRGDAPHLRRQWQDTSGALSESVFIGRRGRSICKAAPSPSRSDKPVIPTQKRE